MLKRRCSTPLHRFMTWCEPNERPETVCKAPGSSRRPIVACEQAQQQLQPACVQALTRVFRLCDADADGVLNNAELNSFQVRCFAVGLSVEELEAVKRVVAERQPSGPSPNDSRCPLSTLARHDLSAAPLSCLVPRRHCRRSHAVRLPVPARSVYRERQDGVNVGRRDSPACRSGEHFIAWPRCMPLMQLAAMRY